MGFPDFETWCAEVLNPDDTDWWDFRTPAWHEYYFNKYRICRSFAPNSVLEIGVRFGYSAHAFMSTGTNLLYTGIDSNNPKHGGWKTPTLDWAKSMLNRTCKNRFFTPTFIVADTQNDCIALTTKYDFVHIDADHSFSGCFKDLINFWPITNRVMLVDDYDQSKTVKDAVDRFVSQKKLLLFHMPSLRGEALIIK
jgi:predicted O-methyltransferase YrrM